MKKRWRAINKGGHITLCDPEGFRKHTEVLGPFLAVTVENWQRTTSNPQFAYYYGVVLQILSAYTGFTRDEMDVVLRDMFLSDFVHVQDRILRKTYSKTTVSTGRFNLFLEEVKRWAAEEFGLYIPDPNEVDPERLADAG
ncbi:MAG: hypothetical protein LLF76_02865 [Planctomycetaceae bacterium]|nr:hypothetical protein [Planctomycetaceae bacterium]